MLRYVTHVMHSSSQPTSRTHFAREAVRMKDETDGRRPPAIVSISQRNSAMSDPGARKEQATSGTSRTREGRTKEMETCVDR